MPYSLNPVCPKFISKFELRFFIYSLVYKKSKYKFSRFTVSQYFSFDFFFSGAGGRKKRGDTPKMLKSYFTVFYMKPNICLENLNKHNIKIIA